MFRAKLNLNHVMKKVMADLRKSPYTDGWIRVTHDFQFDNFCHFIAVTSNFVVTHCRR